MMRTPPILLAAALLLPLVCLPAPTQAAEEPRIRVLSAEGVSGMLVKGKELTISSLGGEEEARGVSRAVLRPAAGAVAIEGSSARAEGFVVSSRDGFCEVNGQVVRGRVVALGDEGTGQGLTLVVSVPLESYLVGLVNGEINSAWPAEAVKAQVVAARTYALWRLARARGERYDVKPDTTHQVYTGVFGEDADAARAVKATRGLALYRDGRLVEALFHSTCGGRTASAEEVWGTAVPGIDSVECRDCSASPQARWEALVPADELSAAVNRLYPGSGTVLGLAVRSLTPSGRVRSLSVTARGGAFLVDAGDLRRELGNTRLPSTAFSVAPGRDGFLFAGRGYGHGAGMCQWGARGAAARGEAFADILKRYYPGAAVERAYR